MPPANPYPFHVLDVFTDRRFAGNPLAVVLNADDLDADEMQLVAAEFNLSETIFVCAPDDEESEAKVRIFTPKSELPFAGHPTIGCAILLAERHWPKGEFDETMVLEEKAGHVPVRVSRKGKKVRASFVAPVIPARSPQAFDRQRMAEALGLGEFDIRGSVPVSQHHGGPSFVYVPVRSLDALERAWPREPAWTAAVVSETTHAAYVYAPDPDAGEEGSLSFRARLFAPTEGIAEDPATGSAAAILASALLDSGELDEGMNSITVRQGIEMDRPSTIHVEADVEGGKLREVRVSGTAVRVSDGQILA